MRILTMLLVLSFSGFSGLSAQTWVQKVPGSGLGNSLTYNPLNLNTVYGSPYNNTLWVSYNRGKTWQTHSTVPVGGIVAVAVSPLDTTHILVAIQKSDPDLIFKTTNNGATWTQTFSGSFSFYGVPMEHKPQHPDLVFTMTGNNFYRSTNFGSTWTLVSTVSGFNAWCDAEVNPADPNMMLVGDNTSGIWKTTNGGLTWVRKHQTTGEIPMISINPFKPNIAYATRWGGGGGFLKSTDWGETWNFVSIWGTANTWSVAASVVDSSFVMACTYSGQVMRFSYDDGETWTLRNQGLTGSGYGAMALDTTSLFALQGTGIFKMRFPGTVRGFVFHDANGNGVYDQGEPALPGWKVHLSLSGTQIDSVITGLEGTYQFTSLNPGSYATTLTTPFGWYLTYPAGGSHSFTVTDGEQFNDRNFGAAQGSMAVMVPNGGETWWVATEETIQWTAAGFSGDVKIELSRDGGMTYETLLANAPNTGSATWTVTGPPTSAALIRVSSVSTPTIFDASDGHFAIALASVTVLSPNGGEVWAIGATETIQWTSVGVTGNLNIELSRDGGLTFATLFSDTPNDGEEEWMLEGPSTSQARVRISSIDPPGPYGMSASNFTIAPAFFFLSTLHLRDNGGMADVLEFGTANGATDGIDPWFGEEELPPRPPQGTFDVRWQIGGTEGSKRDVREVLGGDRVQIIYTGLMQPGLDGYPFTLRWEPAALPQGSFTLRDAVTGGSLFAVNMKTNDSLVITNPAFVSFQLVYRLHTSLTTAVDQGWNILSVPMRVPDRRKEVIFPDAVSGAFAFRPAGYVQQDTLEYGTGYWLKFANSQSLTISGEPVLVDTIDVVRGWNLIGSISVAVPLSSVVQIPSGIVVSSFFEYNGGSYSSASTIEPMRGYWVKVSQNGKLVLMSPE